MRIVFKRVGRMEGISNEHFEDGIACWHGEKVSTAIGIEADMSQSYHMLLVCLKGRMYNYFRLKLQAILHVERLPHLFAHNA